MKIKIYGNNDLAKNLLNTVKLSLEELGLLDFVELEESNDFAIKNELNITKEPALIIEEEAIEFRDMIFEGIVPNEDEIKSMLISIIGGQSNNLCASGGCGTGCSC